MVSAAAQLLVRARRKSDIKQVFPGHPIKETRHTDYRYRTTVPRYVVADTIANRILAIDYDNFKNSVEDHDLHAAYARVWGIMYALVTWSGKVSEWSRRLWRMKKVFYLCENGRNRRLAGNDHDQ